MKLENMTPSKLVFVFLAIIVSIAFLFEIIKGTIVLDSKDFTTLVLMAFAFYYGTPTSGNQNEVAGSGK